jgi:hypothetical protein
MQTTGPAEPSVTRLLLMWARYHLSRRLSAMREKDRAVVIAALTAESGNPPGA